MNFDFTEDQDALRAAVSRWVSGDYGLERRREIAAEGGFSSEAWRGLADLGLLGLRIPERLGGMGLGPIESMIVMEELGRGLLLEPYVHGALLVPHILASASERVQQSLLPAVGAGEQLLVLAHQEPMARYRLDRLETRATQLTAHWVISGRKSVVPAGAFADAFIVPALRTGAAGDADRVALFLVRRDAAGVNVHACVTQDDAAAADLELNHAQAELIIDAGGPDDAQRVLESAMDVGITAVCAEAVGIMEALLAITVEHLNTRRQFGVPIASFQALRHRVADIRLQLELARSMSYLACLKLDEPLEARRRTLSQAKLQLGRSMRFVGQQSLQLHGGIGLTDEYVGSHYFKRLTVIEMSFGDTLHHLGEVAKRMQLSAGVY